MGSTERGFHYMQFMEAGGLASIISMRRTMVSCLTVVSNPGCQNTNTDAGAKVIDLSQAIVSPGLMSLSLIARTWKRTQ